MTGIVIGVVVLTRSFQTHALYALTTVGELPATPAAHRTVSLVELAGNPKYAIGEAPLAELDATVLQAAFTLEPRATSATTLLAAVPMPTTPAAMPATPISAPQTPGVASATASSPVRSRWAELDEWERW